MAFVNELLNRQKDKFQETTWVVDSDTGIEMPEIDSLHVLIQAIGYIKFYLREKGNVLFRGQTKLYSTLTSSLHRQLETQNSFDIRNEALNQYLTSCRGQQDVLAAIPTYAHEPLLQHYGLKTRWIDLVDNVWIALWFACHKANSLTTGSFDSLRYEQRKNSATEYAYLILLLAENPIDKVGSPGLYESENTITIDLRKACPSQFVRPHAQHGLLMRKKQKTSVDSDLYENTVAIIRIKLDNALNWLGKGGLTDVLALFPPPHFDFGYRILLNKAPIPPDIIGRLNIIHP